MSCSINQSTQAPQWARFNFSNTRKAQLVEPFSLFADLDEDSITPNSESIMAKLSGERGHSLNMWFKTAYR
jgi:hypothetical protein